MSQTQALWLTDEDLGIATDLYQIRMLAGYWKLKPKQMGTFEMFVRRVPEGRSCLIACGLEQAVHYLQNVSFAGEKVEQLRHLLRDDDIPSDFFDFLLNFRFQGDLFAMPEGTPFFANEPLLRLTAPLIEAQLAETYLLSVINAQTIVASKAAQVVMAANGKPVVEFGMRRCQGPSTAQLAARASFVGGCAGTSNVGAGLALGIPVIGTMAHSWVQSFPSEMEALTSFREMFPASILLIDTYDTENGARLASKTGPGLAGVRIDSGDLLDLSVKVRKILDGEGQERAKIIVSGNLDEARIRELEARGAPVDSYAVGTEMVTSRDAPSLDIVYKLVEVKDADDGAFWRPVYKMSPGKRTFGGRKQVWREREAPGRYVRDLIALHDEHHANAQMLLVKIMEKGELAAPLPSLLEIRRYAANCQAALGQEYFVTGEKKGYPVDFSEALLAHNR